MWTSTLAILVHLDKDVFLVLLPTCCICRENKGPSKPRTLFTGFDHTSQCRRNHANLYLLLLGDLFGSQNLALSWSPTISFRGYSVVECKCSNRNGFLWEAKSPTEKHITCPETYKGLLCPISGCTALPDTRTWGKSVIHVIKKW